uniref:Uncharacterized protein n=1 Tax=Vibrio anguillarum TaxID=55601 RepID=A0A6M4NXS1_VIBAN|nr:hypothetical protein [Vibrio anguillarum]
MPGAARLGDIGSEHDCFPPTPIISAFHACQLSLFPTIPPIIFLSPSHVFEHLFHS